MNAVATRGFTLIELLVVLVVLTLVLAVAVPLIPNVAPGAALKSAARELTAGLRLARSRAITGNREVTLTLDVEGKRYRIGGDERPRELPPEIDIAFLTARSERLDETIANIRFFPDGSSTGGRIRLGHGEREYSVTIEWLTGRVSIAE